MPKRGPKDKNKLTRLAPTTKTTTTKTITQTSASTTPQISTTTTTTTTTTSTTTSKFEKGESNKSNKEGKEKKRTKGDSEDHTKDHTEDGRKETKKQKKGKKITETDLQWLPQKGDIIYVRWSTFKESEEEVWDQLHTHKLFVKGIYQSRDESGDGWNVYFHDLDEHLVRAEYLLTWEWIQNYGSDTDDDNKEILTKRRIREHRKETRSKLRTDENEDEEEKIYEEQTIVFHQTVSDLDLSEATKILGTGIMSKPENSQGVATLNIAGLNIEQDTTGIIWLQKYREIGLTVLQDTRLKMTDKKHCGKVWQSKAGGGAMVTFSKCNENAGYIGGQAFFMDAFWASKRQNTWSDPSELGIVMEQTFGGQAGKIRVVSVYWPPPERKQEDGKISMQLSAQLKRRMEVLQRPEESIPEYINNMIQSRLKKPSQETILLGDFNRHWTDDFKEEVKLNGLKNLHDSNNHCTRYSGDNPTGTIDYIFSTGTETGGGCEEHINWSTHSDHRPLWSWINLKFGSVQTKYQAKAVEYRATSRENQDGGELAAFQNSMLEGLKKLESMPYKDKLTYLTGLAVRSHRIKKKQVKLKYWSPWVGGCVIWRNMISQLMVERKKKQCYKIIDKAKKKIKGIGKDGDKVWNELNCTIGLKTAETLKQYCHLSLKKSLLLKEKKVIINFLHLSKRKERYNAQMQVIKMRKKGKYLFFKHFRKQRTVTNYSQLQIGNTVYTRPESVDQKLVEKFQNVFKQKRRYEYSLWESCSNLEAFEAKCGAKEIPPELTKLVHTAIYHTYESRKPVEGKLTEEYLAPTFSEFWKVIKNSNDNSAGGPSGLTYRILKDMPEEALQVIFDQMSEHWSKKSLPKWLSKKLLYPIAKKEKEWTDIDNLRPIMLLEVLRKIWAKIIIKKIRTVWEEENILQPTQQGFRTNRGCPNGVLQCVNAMEEADYSKLPLYGTSWDISAAFDSVARPLIELSLRRLGVPQIIADFLAHIDDNDEVTISTPGTENGKRGKSFHTERGVGQGDSISPILWIAFFDIMLTALKLGTDADFFFTDREGKFYSTPDCAFADDLLSITGQQETIQKKADILSALGIILDISFSHKKFRTFTCNVQNPPDIILHNEEWEEIKISFKGDSFIKYLGATMNLVNTSSEEEALLHQKIVEIMNRYTKKVDTPEHHMLYGHAAVMPALTYRTQFAKVRPSKLEQLAKRLRMHAKGKAHLPVSFPTAVLEGPRHEGGIGIEGLADVAARTKLRLIESSLLSTATPDIKAAVEGLLGRELQRQGRLLTEQTMEIGVEVSSGNTWISEAVQHLRATNSVLKCYGQSETNSLDARIPPSIRSYLSDEWDVNTIGDLLEFAHGKMRLITIIPTALDFKAEDLLLIRPGQGWAVGPIRNQHLWIVKGWSDNEVLMEEWIPSVKWIKNRTRLPQCTWAGYKAIPWDIALSLTDRVLMTKKSIQNGMPTRLIIKEFKVCLHKRSARNLHQVVTLQDEIATDGSWKSTPSAFGQTNVTAAAAIVQLDPLNRSSPAQAIRITDFAKDSDTRVFAQETIAVAVAIAGGANTIHTDSKSVCAQARATRPTGNRALDVLKGKTTAQVHHVKSHPEGRKLRQEWTPIEWGNHMADRIADVDPSYPANQLTGEQASNFIMEKTKAWMVCTNKQIMFQSFKHCRSTMALHNYLLSKTHSRYPDIRWIPHLYSYGQSCYGSTIRQRGATAKLALFKFDRDRLFEEGNLESCTCGCQNNLEAWITSCTRSEMENIRSKTRTRVNEILGKDSLFKPYLDSFLEGPQGHMLWRGVWQPFQAEQVEDFLNLQSQDRQKTFKQEIKEITSILIQASLNLYSIASGKSTFNPLVSATARKRKRKEAEEAIFATESNQRIPQDWIKSKVQRRIPPTTRKKSVKAYAIAARTYKILNYFKPDPG